jgi:Skp family chaperone for outer membrane proteins
VRKLLLSAAVFGLVSTAGPRAQAQQQAGPGGNAGRYGIAVVDISFIFKNYPQFTSQIEALKKEMETADGQLKADRDRIVSMEEQRNTLKPGTEQFKQLDEELARQKAEFSIKQGTVRRDFLEREAKVYYQTYNAVSDAVKHYAQQQSIGLVLRFNGDAIDPNQREDVMRAIMQPIVHQSNIDITPDVLLVLGVDVRRTPAAGAAAAPPVAGRPAGGNQLR